MNYKSLIFFMFSQNRNSDSLYKKILFFFKFSQNRNSGALYIKTLSFSIFFKNKNVRPLYEKKLKFSPKTEFFKDIFIFPEKEISKNSFIYLSVKSVCNFASCFFLPKIFYYSIKLGVYLLTKFP